MTGGIKDADGGGCSRNAVGFDPIQSGPCRDCWFGNGIAHPRFNGGGSGSNYRVTIEGLRDINRTLCALGALIENIAVSCGVEIKVRDFFSEGRMNNGFAPKSPVEVMKKEPAVGGGEAGVGGEIQEDGR